MTLEQKIIVIPDGKYVTILMENSATIHLKNMLGRQLKNVW